MKIDEYKSIKLEQYLITIGLGYLTTSKDAKKYAAVNSCDNFSLAMFHNVEMVVLDEVIDFIDDYDIVWYTYMCESNYLKKTRFDKFIFDICKQGYEKLRA